MKKCAYPLLFWRMTEFIMKKRTITSLVAGALGLSILSSCTGLTNKIVFKDAWNYNTNSGYMHIDETLTYSVTFEKSAASFQESFTIDDATGSYTTHLVSVKHGDKDAYQYTTQLEIDVTYIYQGQTKTFTDSVTTEAILLPASNSLRPISSKKTIYSHSPNGSVATSLDSCYSFAHYTVETTYAANGASGTSVIHDNEPKADGTFYQPSTNTFEIDTEDYNYLDNEQLLLALRALPESTSSGSVQVYAPFSKAMQTINFSQATTSTDANKTFKFSVNGAEATEKTIAYRKLNFSINDVNPGATQTVEIAKTVDASKNTYRNVILSLETPLAYSLGTLVYKLTSAEYKDVTSEN